MNITKSLLFYPHSRGYDDYSVVDSSFSEGFDWCIERVKASAFHSLSSELEIAKAITHLKLKDVTHAAQVLKAFEKKDSNMLSAAATNLSFLYILVSLTTALCTFLKMK